MLLPNWGDSAHELTIWERRQQPSTAAQRNSNTSVSASHGEQSGAAKGEHAANAADAALPAGMPLAECAACGAPAATSTIADPSAVPLRRCRHCRDIAFCSKACRIAGSKRHAAGHALRLLFSERKLRFKSADFEPLRLC